STRPGGSPDSRRWAWGRERNGQTRAAYSAHSVWGAGSRHTFGSAATASAHPLPANHAWPSLRTLRLIFSTIVGPSHQHAITPPSPCCRACGVRRRLHALLELVSEQELCGVVAIVESRQ